MARTVEWDEMWINWIRRLKKINEWMNERNSCFWNKGSKILTENLDSQPCESVLKVANFFLLFANLFIQFKNFGNQPIVLFSFAKRFLAFSFHSFLQNQPLNHSRSTTSIQFERYQNLLGVTLHIWNKLLIIINVIYTSQICRRELSANIAINSIFTGTK